MSKTLPSVFIIDDHPLVREAVIGTLQEAQMQICGQERSFKSALPQIKKLRPTIVILDPGQPKGGGLVAIREINQLCPDTGVVVFTGEDEMIFAMRSVRAGALAYVEKTASMEVLVHALRKVAAGDVYLSGAVQRQTFRSLTTRRDPKAQLPAEVLTDRELEIFTLVGKGKTTSEIAGILELSHKTIEAHRAHVKEKLGFETSSQLVHFAIRWVADPNLMS